MNKKVTLVADANIPKLEELLGDIAEITYLPGRSITASDLKNADALLVRSITKVNKELLADTKLSFVGSCTIGTDHVDLDYLAENNIRFANAPGCNAAAVVDYVLTAMLNVNADIDYWKQKTVGIVGLGQVGGRLQKRLAQIGIQTKAYDPFKKEACDSFEQVLSCDVVSLHVPLTKGGDHQTYHLIAHQELKSLKSNALLINTSRGPVIDNSDLLDCLKCQSLHVVLDVYEEEPIPANALLESVDIATSHIAGYSLQGKVRGSMQVAEAFYKHFSIEKPLPDLLNDLNKTIKLTEDSVSALLAASYDIVSDSKLFVEKYRKQQSDDDRALAFDDYRKNYPVRYEWSFIDVSATGYIKDISDMLGYAKK